MVDTFTVSELEVFLKELKTALYQGHLSVSYADKSITYRSTNEMEKAIARIQKEINSQNSVTPTRAHYINSNKGTIC